MKNVIHWILKLVPAFIFLQTLFFKFTGAPESIALFEKLGLGDAGRYGSGVAELIAAILILNPRTTGIGALIGMGVMSGAIISHLTVLGINYGDGLFYLGLAAFICCAILVFLNRKGLPIVGSMFKD